jgi:uncharacterized protein YdaU (DUF1376 family)
MHYYQHHIGDFIKDTHYLTNEEVGIYMKLIWLYYDTEKPLSDNLNTLMIKVGCRNNKDSLLTILHTFFIFNEKHSTWHHTRCDKEIAEYAEFCAKQKANGLKGGRPRATQEKPNDNPMGYQAKPKKTLTTNHKPLTTNHINITPNGFDLFWDAYGKKKGKPNALKEWVKLNLENDQPTIDYLIKKAKQQAIAIPDPKFRKDPERWLKGHHWEDEFLPVEQAVESKPKELPLGTDQQIEHAYKVECKGDPSKANFRSYQEMRKFIQDFRDKSKRALQ